MGQGRNDGGKVSTIPLAPNQYGGAESLHGAPKRPNNATSTFFNILHLLPKYLRFEHRGAKLAYCPGRHLTLLRPWHGAQNKGSRNYTQRF